MNATAKNRVIGKVQVGDIRLLKIDATGPRPGLVVQGEPANVNIKYNGGLIAVPNADGAFSVLAEFSIDVVPTNATESCFVITVQFELKYTLPVGLEYNEDEMRDFVATNAAFNAWPYLRELVQSMTTRMGMLPVTLPLFRHGQPLSSALTEGRDMLTSGTDEKKGESNE